MRSHARVAELFPVAAALLAASATCSASALPKYVVDPTWNLRLPPCVGLFSAVAVSGDLVFVSQRNASFADPVLMLNRAGDLLLSFGAEHVGRANGTFGSHGLAVQPADLVSGRREETIWVMDFFNHAVLSFNLTGELLGKAGRNGAASAEPDGFGNVADAAFRGGSAFFSDGDGGEDNRIERWAAASGRPEHIEWVSPVAPPAGRKKQSFDNPHSVCWHETSDRLIVADRENSRLVLVDPETGALSGELRCDGLGLGTRDGPKPFGVRTLRTADADLLFVAVADNPQDGKNQFVHVVDVSTLAEDGRCKAVLQSIAFAPPGEKGHSRQLGACRTPHLLGVDSNRGDIYLACIAEPGSNVLRLVQSTESGVPLIVS
mmetsp:Transcript_8867/g.22969  ORF Transcript_8867/g.22969 Transcript_8867/m.22969 type:complete len:376 (+) Transcript_8867:70-1197(+)|eukprot:CAMPEP_0117536236 /NCGR_PEP_ID=MMETSP0784-20121206/41348_1 /TAXON_ID=39447 /ORGANISM="" /LENGTH=375 /DNA_ID=CAMNT_0005332791 /DNA_START=49 /DNA_END=1176 /DNA_ORIENTATION=-